MPQHVALLLLVASAVGHAEHRPWTNLSHLPSGGGNAGRHRLRRDEAKIFNTTISTSVPPCTRKGTITRCSNADTCAWNFDTWSCQQCGGVSEDACTGACMWKSVSERIYTLKLSKRQSDSERGKKGGVYREPPRGREKIADFLINTYT